MKWVLSANSWYDLEFDWGIVSIFQYLTKVSASDNQADREKWK